MRAVNPSHPSIPAKSRYTDQNLIQDIYTVNPLLNPIQQKTNTQNKLLAVHFGFLGYIFCLVMFFLITTVMMSKCTYSNIMMYSITGKEESMGLKRHI